MNLINDPWIPVHRLDDTREVIQPWRLTDDHEENPIVALDLPRPDLNGGMLEFLVGLLQTAVILHKNAALGDDEDWLDRLEEPPSPEELQEWFSSFAPAFELDGDGPRFMQELHSLEGEDVGITALLIDSPGANAVRNNLDLFTKRGGVVGLCPAAAAIALFTLQAYSPAGGAGYRTSLRGGGPLTTLVAIDAQAAGVGLGSTLWRDLWLNILTNSRFLRLAGNPSKDKPEDIFPWLAPTRTSEAKTGRVTTPEDVHPLQMFWGMPRRVRLRFDQATKGHCSLFDTATDCLVTHFTAKNYGVNYEGAWRHPLTPHNLDKDTRQPLPRHAQPGGLGYRHWIGLVCAGGDQLREPASVVSALIDRQGDNLYLGKLRVRVLGYDMDNMKPRCWYEQQFPVYHVSTPNYAAFVSTIEKLINAAEETRSYLVGAVKQAWFKRPGDVKGDTAFLDLAFWDGTEPDFYGCLSKLAEGLSSESDSAALRLDIRRRWHGVLAQQALALFDRWAASCRIEFEDPKRIASAYQKLKSLIYGKKLREKILELPKPKEPSKGAVTDDA